MSLHSTLRRSVVVVGLVGLTALGVVTAGPALALPAYGTTPVHVADPSAAQTSVTGVRVGVNDGFDRVVFDLSGPLPGYDVSYVDGITADGSGAPIPMAGSSFLAVSVHSVRGTPAQPTLYPAFRTLQEVRGTGSFEGYASYGLGLSNALGFRVFTLTAPNRLVVDVLQDGVSRPTVSTEPIDVPDPSTGLTNVTGVRVGLHPGYDRIVFDLTGPLPGYTVRSVDAVTQDGSGNPVPILGSAFMTVAIHAVGTAVQPTITTGFPTTEQLVGAGVFEGYASYGIGLTYPAAFSAFTLTNPNRLVVDVITH